MTVNKIPKTGLAMNLRFWMMARIGTKAQRRFTIEQVCEALSCLGTHTDRQKISNVLYDFEQRGEVISSINKKCNRRQYLYCHDWRKELKGKINRKIFKAMYVSQSFAVTDIQRLAGMPDRNWIDKLIRQLTKDGYVQRISRRICAHGAGAENVYHIVNRDKFKLEMMR